MGDPFNTSNNILAIITLLLFLLSHFCWSTCALFTFHVYFTFSSFLLFLSQSFFLFIRSTKVSSNLCETLFTFSFIINVAHAVETLSRRPFSLQLVKSHLVQSFEQYKAAKFPFWSRFVYYILYDTTAAMVLPHSPLYHRFCHSKPICSYFKWPFLTHNCRFVSVGKGCSSIQKVKQL